MIGVDSPGLSRAWRACARSPRTARCGFCAGVLHGRISLSNRQTQAPRTNVEYKIRRITEPLSRRNEKHEQKLFRSYKAAGVDITAGYRAVELMKQHMRAAP